MVGNKTNCKEVFTLSGTVVIICNHDVTNRYVIIHMTD